MIKLEIMCLKIFARFLTHSKFWILKI
jgi:hypothetical protein